jgi:hypothetical protein
MSISWVLFIEKCLQVSPYLSLALLFNEDKLDETQAGLITLASKAALEIHKQIGKNIQSASTAGGVNGFSNLLFITMNLKRLFADFRILERTILS